MLVLQVVTHFTFSVIFQPIWCKVDQTQENIMVLGVKAKMMKDQIFIFFVWMSLQLENENNEGKYSSNNEDSVIGKYSLFTQATTLLKDWLLNTYLWMYKNNKNKISSINTT